MRANKGRYIRARVDSNQAGIIAALRVIGASVAILSPLGHGIPDLLVGFRGNNYLLEVKNGDLIPSRRRLTQKENSFFEDWRGQKAVVDSVDEALDAINARTDQEVKRRITQFHKGW